MPLPNGWNSELMKDTALRSRSTHCDVDRILVFDVVPIDRRTCTLHIDLAADRATLTV